MRRRSATKVLFPTTAGDEVAECIWAPTYVSEEIGGLPMCAGFATSDHLARDERNRARKAEARVTTKRLVRQHELPMKIVGVDYLDTENSFVIYFSAPQRVDFRALVRDLARTLNARIELRQLGARDEARVQGGIGPCGRDTWLLDVLEGLRAGQRADGKRPGSAAESAEDFRCLWAVDVLPEVRAPALHRLQVGPAEDGHGGVVARGRWHVGGYNVPSETVIVKVAETGKRCACPKASVCGSRIEYDAAYGGDPSASPS